MWAGLFGALVGALAGLPLLFGLGAFIGALVGAWIGCYLMERYKADSYTQLNCLNWRLGGLVGSKPRACSLWASFSNHDSGRLV